MIDNITDSDASNALKEKIQKEQQEVEFLERMKKETMKLNPGSIALVNQITTIRKLRIYDSKTDYGILGGIKLSSTSMDLIDEEIVRRYTKK